MKISTTTTHTVKFNIIAYEGQEGGMSIDEFGKTCDNLHEAIVQLDLAFASDPKTPWKIVCDVEKQVAGAKT